MPNLHSPPPWWLDLPLVRQPHFNDSTDRRNVCDLFHRLGMIENAVFDIDYTTDFSSTTGDDADPIIVPFRVTLDFRHAASKPSQIARRLITPLERETINMALQTWFSASGFFRGAFVGFLLDRDVQTSSEPLSYHVVPREMFEHFCGLWFGRNGLTEYDDLATKHALFDVLDRALPTPSTTASVKSTL
jgi:hypothetical protein